MTDRTKNVLAWTVLTLVSAAILAFIILCWELVVALLIIVITVATFIGASAAIAWAGDQLELF